MKIKYLLSIVFFATTLFSLTCLGKSDFVEEKEISTKDGSCSIRYLTDKNIKGWHITADDITCSEDGWLHGYHYLTIRNAFSHPVEELYGYFSYGYWTGSTFVNSPFLTRFTEKTGIQKATFLLTRDEKYQLNYIGQMVAKQNSLGTYGSFQVCNPFRLLIVTDNIPFFADKVKQRRIFKEVEKQVRSICPTEEKVLLFLSPVVEPRQEDIVFYAEINLKDDTKKTKWLEKALKKSGHYEKTIETATLTDNISPNVKDLDLLRKTISKKIGLMPFKTQNNATSVSFNPEKKELLFDDESLIEKSSFINNEKETVELDSDNESFENTEDAFTNPQFLIPKPQKNYQHEQIETNYETDEPVMHLLILSKIKQEPVPVNVIVHVNDNTHNESYTTHPLPLKINNHALKPGWYKIAGSIDAEKNDTIYYGTIYPTTVQNYNPQESKIEK